MQRRHREVDGVRGITAYRRSGRDVSQHRLPRMPVYESSPSNRCLRSGPLFFRMAPAQYLNTPTLLATLTRFPMLESSCFADADYKRALRRKRGERTGRGKVDAAPCDRGPCRGERWRACQYADGCHHRRGALQGSYTHHGQRATRSSCRSGHRRSSTCQTSTSRMRLGTAAYRSTWQPQLLRIILQDKHILSILQTLYLWNAVPALSIGLSIRPPPAISPTMARQLLDTVLRAPEGSLIRVLPASGS